MNTQERARPYIRRMPSSISGNGGHSTTFGVDCTQPPWTEAESRHKLKEAAKNSGARGRLLQDKPDWDDSRLTSSIPQQKLAGGLGGSMPTAVHSPPSLSRTRPVNSEDAKSIAPRRGLDMSAVYFPERQGKLGQVTGGPCDPVRGLVADSPGWPDTISMAEPPSPGHASSIQGSVPDKGDLEGDLINDPRLLQLLDLAEGEGDAAETARADLYTQFGIEVDPAPSETQEAHV